MTLFVWPPQNVNTTGLATEAKQDVTNTNTSNVNTVLSDRLSGSLVPAKFDYIGYTDGGATETFVYKTGGAGGTTQKTVIVTYTDSSKAILVSVTAS